MRRIAVVGGQAISTTIAAMTETTFLTPPGRAWASASAALASELRLLAHNAPPARVAFLVESAVVAASARFQVACRGLFAHAVMTIVLRIGGELGTVVGDGLAADARLARGNATSTALARDFARIGVDVWDLDFPAGSEGMTARFALDDATAFRNELAHGREVEVLEPGLEPADALDVIATFDGVLSVLERGVLERLGDLVIDGGADRGAE